MELEAYGHDKISIHALREEGDILAMLDKIYHTLFLSTPSARRATKRVYLLGSYDNISIHALREEGDRSCLFCPANGSKFLSTPSARRATKPVL